MNQTERLLRRLESGPISPLEALRELGIYRLAARVKDLRAAGHAVETRMVEVRTADGSLATVAEYRLHRAPVQASLWPTQEAREAVGALDMARGMA
jgi:hypothetical protein